MKSKLKFIETRAIEAKAEGSANMFRATDEDLPPCFWPNIEERFWEDLTNRIGENNDSK